MESISIRVLLADDEAAIRNGLQNAIPWETAFKTVFLE